MNDWFQNNVKQNLYGIGKQLIRLWSSSERSEKHLEKIAGQIGKEAERSITLKLDRSELDIKDGVTPEKYKDYFTEAEQKEFLSRIEKLLPKYIPKPKVGPRGKQGKPANEQKIYDKLLKRIPPPEKVNYQKLFKEISTVVKAVVLSKEDAIKTINELVEYGLKNDYSEAKISKTIEVALQKQIESLLANPAVLARALETLKGQDRLSVKAIKGMFPGGGQASGSSTGGSGATAFTQLTDAPASYVGKSGMGVRVNVAETGLEFYTISSSSLTNVYSEAVSFSGATGTLAHTPSAGTLRLFRGGIRLKVTDDYTLAVATITLVQAAGAGETFLADYSY
jgi:hypothetical protein